MGHGRRCRPTALEGGPNVADALGEGFRDFITSQFCRTFPLLRGLRCLTVELGVGFRGQPIHVRKDFFLLERKSVFYKNPHLIKPTSSVPNQLWTLRQAISHHWMFVSGLEEGKGVGLSIS